MAFPTQVKLRHLAVVALNSLEKALPCIPKSTQKMNICQNSCIYLHKNNLSTPKHKPKHKLEKWFIIFGDGVCTYVQKNDQRVKPLFKLVCFSWCLDVDHCTTQVL